MKHLPLRTARIPNVTGTRQTSRQGATLSEVLVALLIMAIGVISLASLFPISVLKTARANQLTVATGIRYNAEAMMQVYPWIFADPDPNDTGPNGIKDRNPFNDYDFAGTQPYLFDPMAMFSRPVPMPATIGALPRFGGGFEFDPPGVAAGTNATAICAGPDTWTVRHEGAITSVDPALTSMIVANLSTALPNQTPAYDQMRVHLIYNGGKSSITRIVTKITAGSVSWSEDLNGNNTPDPGEDLNGNGTLDKHVVPGGFTFESARLESRERRYSWMLLVHPQDQGGSLVGGLSVNPMYDVTVVVYYGRGFTLEEERVYGTTTITGLTNIVSGSAVAFNFQQPRKLTVSWPAGSQPYLKRGGYILDALNGYWYQIENYSDPLGGTSTTVTVTSNVIANPGLVMFPRGVVDVFPIAAQSPPVTTQNQ